MEKRPNNFDGFSYFIKDPNDIERLDPRAAILLEPGQIDFLKNYPKSLEILVKKAAPMTEVPNLAKWLASLWNTPIVLELHTTSELYNMNAVWLRFEVQDENEAEKLPEWKPGFNLLATKKTNRIRVPDLLSKVFQVIGEINHNGYGVAGRLHHPDRIGDEVTFYETLYNDKAFYRLPDLKVFWEYQGGFYTREEERYQFGLHLFEEGMPYFLNQYFESLRLKKEFRLEREGEILS